MRPQTGREKHETEIIINELPGVDRMCDECRRLYNKYAEQVKATEHLTNKRERHDLMSDEWRQMDRFVVNATQLEAHFARRLLTHLFTTHKIAGV